MRKPAFCIYENKDADQLPGHCEADQRLCFRYTDSTNPLLSKSEIYIASTILLLPKYKNSSLYPSSVSGSLVCVGPGRKP